MRPLGTIEGFLILVAWRRVEIRVLDAVLLARLHDADDEVLVGEEDACACVAIDASERASASDRCERRASATLAGCLQGPAAPTCSPQAHRC